MTAEQVAQLEHGHLISLNRETEGDELVAFAAAAATVLVVEDAGDFDETGGWLHVMSDTNDEIVPYDTYDDDTDTITLLTPLVHGYPAGSRVDVWDPDDEGPVVEYVAMVEVDGQEDGDPLEAIVDHQLADKLRQGIRAGRGQSVELEFANGGLRVAKILGKIPVIDGAYVVNPFAAGYKAATQSILSSNWTPVLDWTLTNLTDDITYNAATGEFKVASSGIYSHTFGATYAVGVNGSRRVRPVYVLDGAPAQAGRVVTVAADPVDVTAAETTQIIELHAGDTVRFDSLQNSGGNLDLLPSAYRTSFSLVRVVPIA